MQIEDLSKRPTIESGEDGFRYTIEYTTSELTLAKSIITWRTAEFRSMSDRDACDAAVTKWTELCESRPKYFALTFNRLVRHFKKTPTDARFTEATIDWEPAVRRTVHRVVRWV